jgi:hypothetical protein
MERFERKTGFAGSVGALDEEGALADPLAEIVKFGATHFATVGDFDFRDPRGVEREYALDAFAVGNLADGEGGVHAGTATGENDASEDLDALFTTFNNPAMDLHGVADVEIGDVLLQLL